MTNRHVLGGKNFRWLFGTGLLGMLGLAGCVVQPGGAVAYVGPPAVVVEAPPPVYVEPAPVLVVPFFFGGGGGGRYRR